MKRTSIGWTDFSSNPIKYRDRETGQVVWACVQAADECRHCYAEALASRWNKGHAFTRPNLAKVEPFLDEAELRLLARSPKLAGQKLFLGDMTDIFGDWVPDEWLIRLWGLFFLRQDVTWQLLTKRPKRLADFTERLTSTQAYLASQELQHDGINRVEQWPLPNVWAGTSAGSQRTADLFIPELLRAKVAVRTLSAEPLIASMTLWAWDEDEGALRGPGVVVSGGMMASTPDYPPEGYDDSYPGIDWVMVGGESGAGYRPMELDWLRQVVEQCKAAGVPVYVKQDAAHHPGQRGRIPDDLWIHQFPAPAHQLAAV